MCLSQKGWETVALGDAFLLVSALFDRSCREITDKMIGGGKNGVCVCQVMCGFLPTVTLSSSFFPSLSSGPSGWS